MEEKLKSDLNQSLKAGEAAKVASLRLVLSEVIYLKKQKGDQVTDEDVLGIISKEFKKRQESILAFKSANRTDLVDKEQAEADVLQTYLPAQLDDSALTNLVLDSIKELGATSMADMGKVIGAVKAKTGPSADGGRISLIVKEKLG